MEETNQENQTKKRNYEKYLEGEVWEAPEGEAQARYHLPEETLERRYEDSDNRFHGDAISNQPASTFGLEEPVSVGEWLISMLLLMIPCVGLIMMFVWAFGGGEKKSKSNFFKAQLIFCAVVLGIYLLIAIVGGVSYAVLRS